jgi:hypothetical protein
VGRIRDACRDLEKNHSLYDLATKYDWDEYLVSGDGDLPSPYAVTDFASAAIAVAALSIAELVGRASPGIPTVAVDRRLCSFWFGWSIHPIGWKMPPVRDSRLTGLLVLERPDALLCGI